MTSNIKTIDPVQGLIDYVLDIKPYHTKIVEVLIDHVGSDTVNVIIEDRQQLDVDILFLDDFYEVPLCDDGYGTRSFGSSRNFPITSPNPGISIENYPAINTTTNAVIIPGDASDDLLIGASMYIVTQFEDAIQGVIIGSSGSGAFILSGDRTVEFSGGSPTKTFTVTDSSSNDGSYVISHSVYSPGTDTTAIYVTQTVSASYDSGFIITNGNNTGTFTISAVEYSGGSIDSWSDVTDPTTFLLGDNPYTTVTVNETLNAIPTLFANQSYVAFASVDAIEIIGSLSYSNFLARYTSSPVAYEQTPDEGYLTKTVVGITQSQLDGANEPIPGTGAFVVPGSVNDSNVFVGQTFEVVNSLENNGTYTIVDITYDSVLDTTEFVVNEPVGNLVDGEIRLNIPANVLIVNGDHSSQFVQGTIFDIVSGSMIGTYTTIKSEYIPLEDVTWIRTLEDVFGGDFGDSILGVTSGGSPLLSTFTVGGDKTSKYYAGSKFNIIGSSFNDGKYTVAAAGPTYDIITNTTAVPVTDLISLTADGFIYPFTSGFIKYHVMGYGDTRGVCQYVPGTTVAVQFNEKLTFSGLGLDLSDDIIAYNLENSDTWGFDLPANTIFGSTYPLIPEQTTAPSAPEITDLWFDTTTNTFRQWNGRSWDRVVRVYWHDTVNSLLYYRTKNAYVDTGWVLDFPSVPGYSDVIPASSSIGILDSKVYSATGDPNEVFTLPTPIPSVGSPAVFDAGNLVVRVNGLSAAANALNSSEFTVTSPILQNGDLVSAYVYGDVGPRTNAFVGVYNAVPHVVYHQNVTIDTVNNAFVVNGGNFIDRFVPANTFTGMDADYGQIKGEWFADRIEIIDVNGTTGEITIPGDYAWLFTNGRVFRVQNTTTNNNDFIVQSSVAGGSPVTTTITVSNPTVTESIFYNRGLPVISIDSATDSFVVNGNVAQEFTLGLIVAISNSAVGNNGSWEVVSATYSDISGHTTVTVAGDIPADDVTGNALVQTPIPQIMSRDLGSIIAAVYDPSATSGTSAYNTGQPKTVVVPDPSTLPIDPTVNGITYDWLGPLRIDTNMLPVEITDMTVLDRFGASNELLSVPNRIAILDTDATANTFTVNYTDPVTGVPIDLGDTFGPGYVFTVVDSYADNNADSFESNDAKYVVTSTYFDWSGSPVTGTGNTIITVSSAFTDIPPFSSFDIVGMTIGAGSPFNGNTITLLGDQVATISAFPNGLFKLDQPIISTDPRYNIITVTNVSLVGGNTVLTIDENIIAPLYTGTINFADASYNVGIPYDETNIGGSPLRAWSHGDILREVFVINQSSAENTTSAAITDTIDFGWGSYYDMVIIGTNSLASTVYVAGDTTAVVNVNDVSSIIGSAGNDGTYGIVSATYEIAYNRTAIVLTPTLPTDPIGSPGLYGILRIDNIDVTSWFQYLIKEMNASSNTILVLGDATTDIQVGQQVRVLGTKVNDGMFTVSGAPVFDNVNEQTTLPVTELVKYNESTITAIIGTDTIRVQGNAAQSLEGSDVVFISSSLFNDGVYIVVGVSYDSYYDTSDITVSGGSPLLNPTADGTLMYYQRGGWTEAWRYQGIHLVFEDALGLEAIENVSATIVADGGVLSSSYDYQFWDVGSFDESLATVIRLYSGTFSA